MPNTISFEHNERGFFVIFQGTIDNIPGMDMVKVGPLTLPEMYELQDALNETILKASLESLENPALTNAESPV